MNAHLTKSPKFIVTLGLLTALAALTIDLSLPAIPAMAVALDSSLSHGQKIVGIFVLGMAIGQIPAGLASDRFGRLPTLYVGMAIFLVSATVTAVANDVTILLTARFAQGFGAAAAIVVSRAIVRDIASGTEAAKIMSLLTMIFTAAPVIAPAIGAVLVTHWNWRAPFIVIAVSGLLLLLAIFLFLVETHAAKNKQRPWLQLRSSFAEFFSHRQSIYGLLLTALPAAGYLSLIAVSSALAIDIYGFSLQQYGFIFACAGLSILAGATANRWLVTRFDIMQIMTAGFVIFLLASLQLLIIAWLNVASFWWLWACVCASMFTLGSLQSNSTIIALDPLPQVAGFASSIIGTSQNVSGGIGALLGAVIYDGSIRNSVVIFGVAGTLTTLVFFLRPWLAPGPLAHQRSEGGEATASR